MSLNHIALMGRLTRDPELKHIPSGVAVTTFTLAVERDYAEGGEKKTDFVEIVTWRNTAEFAAKYVSKGQQIVVSGRLQIRDWTDKEGGKRKTAEVVADNVYFAEGKKKDTGAAERNTASAVGYSRAVEADFSEIDDSDPELPFN